MADDSSPQGSVGGLTGTRHHADRLEPIAVIGMAVRLPGARDLAAFWDLVTSGRRGIEHFPSTDGRVRPPTTSV